MRSKSVEPPQYYEGIDEALAYLLNPVASPSSASFAGSIFDEVWVVHPDGSGIVEMSDLVSRLTPLGIMTLNNSGVKVIVRAKTNPYLDQTLKAAFLASLWSFETYQHYKVKPIQ